MGSGRQSGLLYFEQRDEVFAERGVFSFFRPAFKAADGIRRTKFRPYENGMKNPPKKHTGSRQVRHKSAQRRCFPSQSTVNSIMYRSIPALSNPDRGCLSNENKTTSPEKTRESRSLAQEHSKVRCSFHSVTSIALLRHFQQSAFSHANAAHGDQTATSPVHLKR